MVYRTRDYVAVRAMDSDGLVGYALGFARGVGVVDGLRTIAPLAIGRRPTDPTAMLESVRRAFIPGWPGLVRSASLLDVAFWDIAAKMAGVPLARLIEPTRELRAQIPALAVAGYFADQRSVESVVQEVGARVTEGYRRVKLVLTPGLRGRDVAVFSALRAAFGRELALSCDAHAAWQTVDEALAACRTLKPFGLEFIEDPFAPQAWRLTRQLRATLGVPIAAGEDVVGIEGFEDAIEAADVVRIDATSSGGVTTALSAIDRSQPAGRSVLPVIWPGINAQLAAARPIVSAVEVIPRDTGVELSWQLLRSEPVIADGICAVDTEAGAGLALDWDAVTRSADAILKL
ncbi:MAG: hypothetical protein HQ485_12765 [Acidobacteria bacterium]|nr:hypothetical protein [Acidobacteriota bacterium]